MGNLSFDIKPTYNRFGNSDSDVYFSIKTDRKSTRVTFTGTSVYKITNKDRLVAALRGNRLYFKEDEKGYKILKKNGNPRVTLTNCNIWKLAKDSEPTSDLMFDSDEGYWYVAFKPKAVNE